MENSKYLEIKKYSAETVYERFIELKREYENLVMHKDKLEKLLYLSNLSALSRSISIPYGKEESVELDVINYDEAVEKQIDVEYSWLKENS